MKENLNAEECAENAEDAKTTGNVDAEAREADEKQEEPEKEMTSGEEAECDAEEASEEASTGDKDKKGFKFFKKDKKDERDEKIAELTDRLQRNMAEFDNFRKRTEKEKSSMYEMGARSVIEKILPVIDNFERGLDTVPTDEADSPFTEGMRMIYKQMMTELENIGVKPIEALGTEFNPDFHNAVMQVESEEYESGYVAQELQKGYMYRDSVVRHSMVAVVS